MTAYFLIDTNIWVNIMSQPWEKDWLEQLEKIVKENHIKLLVPELLLEEWQDQKTKKLKLLKDLFSSAEKHLTKEASLAHFNSEFVQTAERISCLLEAGILINVSNEVVLENYRRSRQKLAPYHLPGNKPVQNDSAIFFSTVEYMVKKQLSEFIFVSNNYHDFGDTKNKQNLHPDLHQENVQIQYYTSLQQCFYFLKELLPLADFNPVVNKDDTGVITFSGVNYDASLLDILYRVLRVIREQISFLPLHILFNVNPFRIADAKETYSHYSNFTIYTNNTSLVDFFREIEIKKRKVKFKTDSHYKNTKQNLLKIKFIIESLNENLVFEIGGLSYGETVDIRLEDKIGCDCISCNYKNLQFEKVIKKLFEKNEEDKSEKAFIAYQFGLYSKALELYYDIYKSAVTKKQNILKYRMQLHLTWGSGFTGSAYSKENHDIIKEIKSFKLDEEFHSLFSSSKFDRQVSAFFYDGIFNYHYTTEISDILEKIRDNYDIQLRAGSSSNSNYWNLVGLYAQFELFIKGNCMPFTRYSNFKKVFDMYIEGIFLCYALNEYQPTKLRYLTDFHLEQIVFNSTPEKIIQLYNHHILTRMTYTSDHAQPAFQKIVTNYFAGSAEFLSSPHTENSSKQTFELEHGKYFWNIIVILTIVKFDNSFIKKCGEMILQYLRQSENIMLYNLKFLGSFIIYHGNTLGKLFLKKLLSLFADKSILHVDSLFASFSKIIRIKPVILLTTPKDLEWVCKTFLEQCPKCGSSHFESLFNMYSIMSVPLQKEMQQIIEKKLDENFDHKMYYRASIQGIINYRKYFSSYLEIFVAPSKGWKDHPFYLAGEIDHPELSELINLVFKNSIKLPEEFLERVKGYSDYYEWLLDMKNFDYKKFNPLWIIQYRTKYYLQSIFNHKQIREKVKEYLKTNPQPLLAKDYALYVG